MRPDNQLPRHNIYKIIHKYARAEINRVVTLGGCTDPINEKEIAYFKQQFNDLIDFLNDHAYREDNYIHPLLKETNSTTLLSVEKEHHQLDVMIKQLQSSLDRVMCPEIFYQFYLDLVNFQSAYYNHLNSEERQLLIDLQNKFSDEKLEEISKELMKGIPPESVIKITKGMLPVINHTERVEIFSSMKLSMPPKILKNMCDLACSVLDSVQFSKLIEEARIDYNNINSKENTVKENTLFNPGVQLPGSSIKSNYLSK